MNRSAERSPLSRVSRTVKVLPENTALPLLLRRPGRFARLYWLPLLLLAAASAADAATTLSNMHELGPEIEVHLVQRLFCQAFGATVGVPLAKLIQVGFVVLVAAWWRPWCAWLMAGCGILYGLAAVSNHFLLL